MSLRMALFISLVAADINAVLKEIRKLDETATQDDITP